MTDLVLLTHDGPISTLTINRPDSLNALDRPTLEALRAAIEEVAARCSSGTGGSGGPSETGGASASGTRVLIVTGAGDRAFVAGADIAAMSNMTQAEAEAFARLGQAVFASLEALPIPVIAAVTGFALGGGCELALSCDFIYASDKAKFGQPEVKLGIIPGFGGTQRLARRIGLGLARELIYTGRMIGPEEALRIGLANAVAPRRELMDKVLETARAIVAVGPNAVAVAKQVVNAGMDLPLADAIALEARAFGLSFGPEQREGMDAFLARRPANFGSGPSVSADALAPTKRAIATEHAPKAVGPYSQAIAANGFLFLSGQVPLDPGTGKLIESPDVGDHVRRVMDNLKAVLEAAGSGLDRTVKVTIYLADIADFPEVNRAYGAYFGDRPPARATIQVGALPLGARVEVDLIALSS